MKTEIAQAIADSRKTRLAICEEAGISRQVLWRAESGRTTRLRIEIAIRIAAAIGCGVDVIRPDLKGMLK
jgi:transcriptional regulator with XRE-family HTH domain